MSLKKGVVSLKDFKIIDKLGSGSFGAVYAVQKATGGKLSTNKKMYAMKILDKEKVYSDNTAQYTLSERNILSIAGRHPMLVGLDYAFQNEYRLYLILELAPGGNLHQ